MITSKGDSKMSARRVKTSGWAAFDLKQRQKDGIVAESGDELFPSLGTTITSLQPCKTSVRDKHVKSFSSAIQPSLHFPTLIQDNMRSKSSEVGSSENHQISELSLEVKSSLVFKQLKEIFVWADDSLIEDVIAATGNDVDKASSFLKAMVSDQRSHELEITEEENHTKLICKKEDESLKDVHEPAKMCSVTEPCLGSKNNNVSNDFAENLYNDYMEINAILGQLTSIPVEPEWEEDDVYLSCRKDAIKKIRAATRHSKAATNSFLRGDHKSAQQFSLKAREDWGAAQSLNAKAACEILRIRNENNGIWRLDLHGLHASEAVEAVKKRLFMIETHFLSKGSRHSELPNSSKSMPVNKSEEHASYRLKPIWLEVITGIGNHSRGGAALPTAVRTFLADNGYRFDEARPGVIMVRPKFRANGMT